MLVCPASSRARADGGDLAVHHPARRGDVGAGVGLRDRGPGVELEGGVVVDVAVGADDAAVAVVGVLVDAEVGDEHHLVADLGAQVGERELHDAVGIPGAGALGVLVGGHAEEDHAGDAEGGELADLLAERLAGVLHHAGQAGDRLRLGDALPHEQRRDQVVDGDAGLGDEAAQGRGAAQPAEPALGEGHGVRLPASPVRSPGRPAARRSGTVRSATESTTRSAWAKSLNRVMRLGTATAVMPGRLGRRDAVGRVLQRDRAGGIGAEVGAGAEVHVGRRLADAADEVGADHRAEAGSDAQPPEVAVEPLERRRRRHADRDARGREAVDEHLDAREQRERVAVRAGLRARRSPRTPRCRSPRCPSPA